MSEIVKEIMLDVLKGPKTVKYMLDWMRFYYMIDTKIGIERSKYPAMIDFVERYQAEDE